MAKKAKNKSARSAKSKDFENDIVDIILDDHKQIKKLIKVMKDTDIDLQERIDAFQEFVPTLIAHAHPEEEVLYSYLKADDELREEGFEGEVEHTLADQMLEEAKRTQDEDILSAKIKVLAELVEHHIEEEEENILPDFRKRSDAEERDEMGMEFLAIKAEYESGEEVDSLSEEDEDFDDQYAS